MSYILRFKSAIPGKKLYIENMINLLLPLQSTVLFIVPLELFLTLTLSLKLMKLLTSMKLFPLTSAVIIL